MRQVKEINFKNQTCYFFDEMININKFYYIGYITIKKSGDCENIHSVNPLYLIIHSATGHFNEKNYATYLILCSTDKYEEVLSGNRSEIKTLNAGKELFYKKKYPRIGIHTEDDYL